MGNSAEAVKLENPVPVADFDFQIASSERIVPFPPASERSPPGIITDPAFPFSSPEIGILENIRVIFLRVDYHSS